MSQSTLWVNNTKQTHVRRLIRAGEMLRHVGMTLIQRLASADTLSYIPASVAPVLERRRRRRASTEAMLAQRHVLQPGCFMINCESCDLWLIRGNVRKHHV